MRGGDMCSAVSCDCPHGKLLKSPSVLDSSRRSSYGRDAYPELADKRDTFIRSLPARKRVCNPGRWASDSESFVQEMKEEGAVLSGAKAFKLYDTYGFPTDLTEEILEEDGFSMDMDGFRKEMEAQRIRAREARSETNYMGAKATVYNELDPAMETTFVGYEQLYTENSKIVAITSGDNVVQEAAQGCKVTVFADQTPFYATMGGQHGDFGTIQTESGIVAVEETIKAIGDKIGHVGTVIDGTIRCGQTARMVVDERNRLSTARNHSATHLLQKALRNVLGAHVEQAGSDVNGDRLRFDFTHFQAMTPEELEAVEREVNGKILSALPVQTQQTSMEEARKAGAMALFGEKYGAVVRMVSMGDYSVELCGGTHLTNTAQAGCFKILSESGIAAGVRRIEALTGEKALEYFQRQNKPTDIAAILRRQRPVVEQMESLTHQVKGYRGKWVP
ncbi:MAG: alanine--tRNA ligase-related protein [Bianqueaceae bacterium]